MFYQLLIVSINIIIGVFIGHRVLLSFKLKKVYSKVIFWIIFMLFSCSYIISSIFNGILPYDITKYLNILGSYYLAFFAYIALLFPVAFILSRIFKKKSKKVDFYLISLVFVTLIVSCGYYFAHSPYIKTYDVKTDKQLENGSLKIAMVSDIHLGYLVKNNQLSQMISDINAENPDIVLLAGDVIDYDLTPVIKDNMLSQFNNLKSKYGTYACLGNHDYYNGTSDELVNLLTENNIKVLQDSSTLINNDFYVIGRNDKTTSLFNGTRTPLSKITDGIDTSKATLLLDHEPRNFSESIDSNIDLQVSGHTHKGQLFPFNFVTHAIFQSDYGYTKYNNTNVIVTSGYGTWGPPIRTNSRSEIVMINLHN